MFAFALLVHAGFLALMANARMKRGPVDDGPVVETMILPSPPLRTARAANPVPAPAGPSRSRSAPHAIAAPRPLMSPALEASLSAPEPIASAASAPLELALSRDQIKALIAREKPTLAQLAPRTVKASPFDALAGDDNADGMTLIELPHGVTEVHLHGECYRLIPTPRAQSDPFNHANERLTGPCIGNF